MKTKYRGLFRAAQRLRRAGGELPDHGRLRSAAMRERTNPTRTERGGSSVAPRVAKPAEWRSDATCASTNHARTARKGSSGVSAGAVIRHLACRTAVASLALAAVIFLAPVVAEAQA